MAKAVKVVTSEFEDLVALGLAQLLSEQNNIALLESGVPIERIEGALERHEPDVLLVNFGSLASPAAVAQLHQEFPGTRVVVLANRPTSQECNQLLSLGATGCISKETEGRDVVNAVHLASRGMHVLPRSAGVVGGRSGVSGSDLLTPREADVLELLQQGDGNAQIAHSLSIGIETVRTHARNIYRKLGISSRRELARLGRPGLTTAPAIEQEPTGKGGRG
ncbi:MAG: response regulator transcription factor [Thermoleophilaceae bacterium]